MGPPGPCRQSRAGRTLGLLRHELGGTANQGGSNEIDAEGLAAIRTLPLLTKTHTGDAVVALTSASQAASAGATTSLAPTTSRVPAPGISAPADVVARAADGSVQRGQARRPGGHPGDGELCAHQRHDRGGHELLAREGWPVQLGRLDLIRPGQGDPGLAKDTFDAINNQLASGLEKGTVQSPAAATGRPAARMPAASQ
jgi:hypothetical protein